MKQNRRVEDYLKVIYRLRDTKVRGVDIRRAEAYGGYEPGGL